MKGLTGERPPKVRTYKQSCVHLWFGERFNEPCDGLTDTDAALSRFVAPACAVGVRLEDDDGISVAAPFGLDDMFGLVLRPNPQRPRAAGWDKVVASATARWPELTIISGDA